MDDLTALAAAAQQGDHDALAALVRRTQADVWRLCAHIAGRERADDLTQETFIRVWRSLPTFEARSGIRTWLLAIARHTAIDGLRAASRRPTVAALPADDAAALTVASPAGLVTTELLLAGLDPDRRTALWLTQILGLSYEEAATVCDVPVGTIRSRVARARADLAAQLGLINSEAQPGAGG
jgi:RNA polymerase sigma-70 factor (ECF subfamily)